MGCIPGHGAYVSPDGDNDVEQMTDAAPRGFLQFQDVRTFLDSVLDDDIHTKRVDSLAAVLNATEARLHSERSFGVR